MGQIPIEQRLLNLKAEMEEAATKSAEMKGQITMLEQQLKKEHKCDSIKQAEEKIKSLSEKAEKLESQIEKGVQQLEEKYEF